MNTVLLVEDSLTESGIISRYLEAAGLKVVLARNVKEAQQRLTTPKPDLIVLDIILPEQSGFELCRELRANPSTVSIPIVMCSTRQSDADRVWSNLLGADAYLTKPVNDQALVETVTRLIKRRS
ncbi:MAG: response regulator [Leptolyngbyaceae bacterium]|nr:response regulator [Leptolyngbyaceae bacterium]